MTTRTGIVGEREAEHVSTAAEPWKAFGRWSGRFRPRRRNDHAMIVGIDASRNRSGGAKGHLIGILSEGDPLRHGIQEVHVWAYQALLDAVPDRPWAVKHHPKELEQSLLRQVPWQRWSLPEEARRVNCSNHVEYGCRHSLAIPPGSDDEPRHALL